MSELEKALALAAERAAELAVAQVMARLEAGQLAVQTPALSSRDAAAMLGLTETTLRQWRGRGEGPAFAKAGRKVVYARSDVERWLAARRRGAP